MEAELNTSTRARKALWFSLSLGIVTLFGLIFLLYQISVTVPVLGWQTYMALGVIALFGICSWLSVWFSYRQHHERGMFILLTGLMLMILALPFLVTNRTIPVAILGVLLTASLATQTLPDRPTNRWISISVFTSITAVLLDLWMPFERISTQFSPLPLFALTILAGVFLLILLMQFRRLRLRTKLLMIFTAVPGITVLLVGGFFLYSFLNNLNAQISQSSTFSIQSKAEQITTFLSGVGNDVQFLSQSTALDNYLSTLAAADSAATAAARQELNAEFLAFAQARGIYDQVRFLDAAGQEIVRINTDQNGVAAIVPPEALQNKSGRYYFDDTLALSSGELMISPLDLNVENEQIELPHKPVIRYGTPVIFNGEKVGVIILNVLADRFLSYLEDANSVDVLVDANGYYLYHPDENKRWGGDLGTGITISQDSPALAEVLFSGTAGTFADDAYQFTYMPVVVPGQENPGWYLVNETAKDVSLATVNEALRVSQAVLAISLLLTPLLALLFSQAITRPVTALAESAREISQGNLDVEVKVASQDEFGLLAQTFNGMAQRLKEAFGLLESRVNARTRDLALAAELGRNLSQVHNLDVLLQTAVDLICERFDLYYTQIYLTNETQQILALRAGTGEAGQQLRQARHTLPFGPGSINGTAAAQKTPVVVADTAQDSRFQPNPLLPLTRSEMAIPMLIGERVVGVLNLQSDQANELTEENLPAFAALAGQLAIAIENATLFTETLEARAEIESYTRRVAGAGWDSYLDGIARPSTIGYIFDAETNSVQSNADQENDLNTSLEIPIAVIDEPVGSIQIEMNGDHQWTEEDITLIQNVAREVGQQIENLRLLEDATRYQAEADKVLRRLTHEAWQSAQETTELTDRLVYDQKQVYRVPGDTLAESLLITQPMRIRDEVIGELSVASDGNLGQDEVEGITAVVAEQLSRHLENLRLAEATEQALSEAQRRSRELSVLNRVVTKISAVNGLQASMQVIVEETAAATGVNQVRVALFNEHRTHLAVIAEHFDASRSPSALGQEIPVVGNMLTEQVIRSKQPCYVADALTSPLTESIVEMLEEQGIISLAVLPIIVSGEVVGTMGLDVLDAGKTINAEQLQLAEAIMLQAATAIEKARLFEQMETRAEELAVINEVAQVVSQQVDQQSLLLTVYEQIRRIMPVDACFVALHNQETNMVEYPFVYDNGRTYQEAPSPYRKTSNIAKVVESGMPVLINRTSEEIQNIILGQQSTMIGDQQKPSASLLYVPLRLGQGVAGVLSIHSYELNAYSQANTTLLSGIANHVAVAMDNARLLTESRKAAQRAQLLRDISGNINAALDAESILQTAAREIGRSLGLQTYVYLKNPDDDDHKHTPDVEAAEPMPH